MIQNEFSFFGAGTQTKTSVPKELPKVFTVTQLTRWIKLILAEHLPEKVVVTGEISNCKRHDSGHLYLTLKDDNAQIGAAMWRSAANTLKFRPADGMAVVATGHIDVYEPQGKYQLYIDKLEPSGIGALELAYRQLADKLRKEGLFDERHKKRLPAFPTTIAIVTSPTGAAIEDITKTLNRRFGIVRKLLYPVAVQGESAGAAIASAIADINRRCGQLGGVDLIIVGRGGGSIEDLWAFNEEVVARAIFASKIPIITGIGHEVDTTISDLVADARGPTPTAAAELAVPVQAEIMEDLYQLQQRLKYNLAQRLEIASGALRGVGGRALFTRPLDKVFFQQQFLDEQTASLTQYLSERLRRAARIVESYAGVLGKIEPRVALNRARTRLTEHHQLLKMAVREYRQRCRHCVGNLAVQLHAASPLGRAQYQSTLLAHLTDRFDKAEEQLFWRCDHQLQSCQKRLENLNPRAVLLRGYSITREKDSCRIVSSDRKVKLGDILSTELAHNIIIESQVTSPG